MSSWLQVRSQAPSTFPDDYHGRLTSLPSVEAIKPFDWLEKGLGAEGIDKLPEPDRIIAAAMNWNAEDYAQTKCSFFEQYHAGMQDVSRKTKAQWCNLLKFGASKRKGERLLDMWEALGWLDERHYSGGQSLGQAGSSEHRKASGAGNVWSQEEHSALAKIMLDIDTDPAYANIGTTNRSKICSERLMTEFGFDRSLGAVHAHRKKNNDRLSVAFGSNHQTEALVNGHNPGRDTNGAAGISSTGRLNSNRA